MSALLGAAATWAALGFALLLVAGGLTGLVRPHQAGARLLAVPVIGLLVSASAAMLALEIALLTDDFGVEYVANNSASTTPLLYKVASAWGALEGSLVLWGLVLAAFTFAIWRAMARVDGADALWSGALGIMGLITVFFFALMVTVSNPFEVCTATTGAGCAAKSAWPWAAAVTPAHGLGPNPLLQNHPLMAVHPPALYLGYVGMSAPFAFAMASLLSGESGDRWLRVTRNWTRVAWVFLTLGIVLGGLWSYEVLGWGGYWAWDPVENASLLPWLAATMFIHTAALQLRRGVLQAWSYGLVIATFALTILGTFLTRSGVVNSVHSFTQSAIGPVLLWFLGFVLIGSLTVYVLRHAEVGSASRVDSLASREGMFMINNLLLGLITFVVLVGTLYPMFVEWFTGDQLGVGRPFFDRMVVPISLVLVAAMAVGPIIPFRRALPGVVWARVRTPLRVALASSAVAVLAWTRNGWIVVSLFLCAFVIGVAVRQMWASARSPSAGGGPAPARLMRLLRRDAGFWGGQAAHIGIAVLALGIAISANQAAQTTVDLVPGETTRFAGLEVTFRGTFTRDDPNRSVFGATLEVRREGRLISVLEPRLNQYTPWSQAVASPAVATGIGGDLYTALARIEPGSVTVNLSWFPFIWMVWAGGFLTAAGGAWAWLARAPRRRLQAEAAPHA